MTLSAYYPAIAREAQLEALKKQYKLLSFKNMYRMFFAFVALPYNLTSGVLLFFFAPDLFAFMFDYSRPTLLEIPLLRLVGLMCLYETVRSFTVTFKVTDHKVRGRLTLTTTLLHFAVFLLHLAYHDIYTRFFATVALVSSLLVTLAGALTYSLYLRDRHALQLRKKKAEADENDLPDYDTTA